MLAQTAVRDAMLSGWAGMSIVLLKTNIMQTAGHLLNKQQQLALQLLSLASADDHDSWQTGRIHASTMPSASMH